MKPGVWFLAWPGCRLLAGVNFSYSLSSPSSLISSNKIFSPKCLSLRVKNLRLELGEESKICFPRASSLSLSLTHVFLSLGVAFALCLRFHIPSRGHWFAGGKASSFLFTHNTRTHTHARTHLCFHHFRGHYTNLHWRLIGMLTTAVTYLTLHDSKPNLI